MPTCLFETVARIAVASSVSLVGPKAPCIKANFAVSKLKFVKVASHYFNLLQKNLLRGKSMLLWLCGGASGEW